MSGTRISVDSIKIHGVGMDTPLITRCVSNVDHENGVTIEGPQSGNSYDEVLFVTQAIANLTWAARAIGSILANIPMLGTKCITADGSHPGVVLYGQKHDPCGVSGRASGSVNMAIVIPKCFVAITKVGGSVGQSAAADMRVIPVSTDGVARPWTKAHNVALPSSGIIVDEEYVIDAPQYSAGNYVLAKDAIQSWSIDMGNGITTIVGAGSIYPTAIDWTKSQPKISIPHTDLTVVNDNGGSADVPQEGKQIAGWIFPLIRRDPFADLKDLTDPSHAYIKAWGKVTPTKIASGSGAAAMAGELQVGCTEATGHTPLEATTSVALA